MSSYHIHRHDDTGNWRCGGGYATLEHAEIDAKNIIRTRTDKAGETWKETTPSEGRLKAWVNNKGHRLEVLETK